VTQVDVALSNQFLGWIFSLGTDVRVLAPQEVVEKFRGELGALGAMYRDGDI
jgi:predicted DNA-binding transcriptional regulator YafY